MAKCFNYLVQLLVLASLVACPVRCWAHKDRLAKLSEAELTFEDGGTVRIAKDRTKLLKLSFESPDGSSEVPVSDLADVDFPLVDSMEVTWSRFSGMRDGSLNGVSYRCIRIAFGGKEKERFGEKPVAMFYFFDGKYRERRTRTRIEQNGWKEDLYVRPDSSGLRDPRPNKSLQPTPTAVMPPAAQEIMPAVGVAEQ
jgi:hypothetical protein